MTRVCKRCKTEKEISEFSVDKRNPDWENKICKKCNYQRNKENILKDPDKRIKWRRYYNWKRRNIINPEKGIELLKTVDACQICGTKDKLFHVDHNHKTGEIRGLLCTTCNLGLGAFLDNSELMRKAADYLDKNGKVVYTNV